MDKMCKTCGDTGKVPKIISFSESAPKTENCPDCTPKADSDDIREAFEEWCEDPSYSEEEIKFSDVILLNGFGVDVRRSFFAGYKSAQQKPQAEIEEYHTIIVGMNRMKNEDDLRIKELEQQIEKMKYEKEYH